MKLKLLILLLFTQVFTLGQSSDPAPTKVELQSGNISDYDRNLMKTYEHSGYHQRNMEEKFKEECEAQGRSESECNNLKRGGDALDGEKFLGLSPTMIKALSKAYSMIIGLGGLGSTLVKDKEEKPAASDEATSGAEDATQETTDVAEDTETPDEVSEKEETTEDYCRYIVMGTETIATFMQQKENEQIASVPASDQTAQVQMLYNQKNSHLSRARSVKTQVIGWGAGTACYTAMMVGPASATSYKNWLKLGATALMWRYYSWEKKTHEKAAGLIQNVIDKLGAKGDCNPISDRACYCAQPETQNDTKYCLPQIREGYAGNEYQVSCVTEDLKNDPGCSCANTDTCLDKRIKASLADIHIPKTLSNNLNPYFEMTKGTAKEGANEYGIDSNADSLNSAASSLLKRSADLMKLPKGVLTKTQAEQAKAIEQFLPNKVAKTFSLAKTPSSAKAAEKNFNRANNAIANFGQMNRQRSSQSKVRVRGGSGLEDAGMNKKIVNPFAKVNTSRSSNKIIKFADRATKSAQIYKDKGVNIFDVVSSRYRKTARKRLNVK